MLVLVAWAYLMRKFVVVNFTVSKSQCWREDLTFTSSPLHTYTVHTHTLSHIHTWVNFIGNKDIERPFVFWKSHKSKRNKNLKDMPNTLTQYTGYSTNSYRGNSYTYWYVLGYIYYTAVSEFCHSIFWFWHGRNPEAADKN